MPKWVDSSDTVEILTELSKKEVLEKIRAENYTRNECSSVLDLNTLTSEEKSELEKAIEILNNDYATRHKALIRRYGKF